MKIFVKCLFNFLLLNWLESLQHSNQWKESSARIRDWSIAGKFYATMVNPLDHTGLKRHWPVILPLLRAGGGRCSVKPASRGALHSRNHGPPAFANDPWSNSRLGTGGPAYYHFEPDPMNLTQSSTTLMPPLGSQALVTELGDGAVSFDKTINTKSFSIQTMWD
ncbi:hypothetical protein ACOSP7_022929 [Xanthoceras sorbifolium]